MSIITLSSDFGLNDWFAGTMKGVILTINPLAQIVDLAHGIPSGDIVGGAIALVSSYKYFPKRTIHVAIVDPGVGSDRAAIGVETEEYWFIGPDNGLLSLALSGEDVKTICRLENPEYFRHPVSPTFHGRDIFAPAAAHLSNGIPLKKFGPEMEDYKQLDMLAPEVEDGKIRGHIVYFDRFGNAFTNITLAHLGDIPPDQVTISLPKHKHIKLGRFYQQTAPGHPIAIIGSSSFLEISVNRGNAAEQLHLKIGDPVVVG